MDYKDYSITLRQSEPGKWRAEIRRLDGRAMKAVGTDNTFVSLPTSPDQYTREAAVQLAKDAIDGGGLS